MDEDYDNEYSDPRERTVSELEEVHSTLEEIHETLKSRTDFSVLVWFFLGFLFFEGWSGSKLDRWTDKVWYSFADSAEFKNITVNKRPSDCDFFYAPLGNKGCQYKKRTNVFGDEQRRAFMQQATTTEEQQAYAKQPNSVTVYWEKKED
jgi:hypothetical protein